MRNRTDLKRGPGPLTIAAICVSVLTVGGLGAIGGLTYLGLIDPVSLLRGARGNPYAGLVPLPLSGTDIPAYTSVTRDHLFDRQNRLPIKYMYVNPKEMDPEWITNASKIANRVLSRDKGAGYAFYESDFLPRGTRPGLVAGIPAGKRAMTLDANKVSGLRELQIGDRFDLLASEAVNLKDMQPQLRWKAGGKGPSGGVASAADGKTSVMVLVDNGFVVTRPAGARPASQPAGSPMLNQLTGNDAPGSNKNDPKDMTIALETSEIAPLTEALSTKATLFCVARSGLPTEKHDTKIPDQDPLANVSMIETVRGRKFGMEAFASSEGKPLPEQNEKGVMPRPLPIANPSFEVADPRTYRDRPRSQKTSRGA